jgi:arylmalonate decarboxylase
VTTAYTDVVNRRLRELLQAAGFEVKSLEAFHIVEFGGPSRISEADIIALSAESLRKATDADGLVVSCGGLRTLGVHKPLEDCHGLPVVSSTPAAFWAAMRLIGESGHVTGHGRLLEQAAPVH